MVDIISLIVIGGITYYLIKSGTLDSIIQNLGITGGGAAATTGAAGGYDSRTAYKTPSTGYTRGSGSYGGGSPGWYTIGPNTGGQGHHHCVAGTSGCYCTDPAKCVSQGVPPTAPGQCKPEFGTKQYLGGGPYPDQSQLPQQIAKCPAGTH